LRHRRRIVLFLITVVFPCLVVIALGLRTVRQDRELAEKRALEERGRQIDQVRKDALNKLAEIRLRVAAGQRPAGVVVVAPGKRLVTARDAEIEEGERAEFAGNDPAKAAEHYRRAVAATKQPVRAAYARLLVARALHKSGNIAGAEAEWRVLLNLPFDAADEHGVPFALYAAERLNVLPPRVFEQIDLLPATALYLLKNLTSDARVPERIEWAERAEALAHELSALAARFPLEEVWAPLGDPQWLAGAVRPLQGGAAILLAVPATSVLPSLDPAGVELGAEFPGVKVSIPAPQALPGYSANAMLYAALALVLCVTLFGGYLLWRDVRRELAVAQMRSQFVSSVTHELKTPLTAIRMFAETLRLRGSADQRMHGEYLDTIIHESERLSRLVDNVLDFSKIERGRKVYNFEPVALEAVMEAAAQTMQYPLAQSGFRLAVQADAGVPAVRADKDALEQAVLNLLTNAMKYSGAAREIALRLHRDNGHAVIQVEDHGVGIAPEDQTRIFEQFYRASSPENQSVPGAGLGLTVVEHIARAHGGEVAVRSTPGEGSTFSIRIPVETGA
jgi:signal transduction histidine kinase